MLVRRCGGCVVKITLGSYGPIFLAPIEQFPERPQCDPNGPFLARVALYRTRRGERIHLGSPAPHVRISLSKGRAGFRFRLSLWSSLRVRPRSVSPKRAPMTPRRPTTTHTGSHLNSATRFCCNTEAQDGRTPEKRMRS